MKRSISKKIKRQVAERASYRCEYCQVREEDSFLPFEIDHIISLKHGGGNEMSNLAFACPHCNQHKGTDLTTFLESYQEIVSLFNPRIHNWQEHFSFKGGEIFPISRVGVATTKLLKFNEPERLIFRQLLAEVGLWP